VMPAPPPTCNTHIFISWQGKWSLLHVRCSCNAWGMCSTQKGSAAWGGDALGLLRPDSAFFPGCVTPLHRCYGFAHHRYDLRDSSVPTERCAARKRTVP
jgi:hypothetical protein